MGNRTSLLLSPVAEEYDGEGKDGSERHEVISA